MYNVVKHTILQYYRSKKRLYYKVLFWCLVQLLQNPHSSESCVCLHVGLHACILFRNLLRFYLWSDIYNEKKYWLKQIISLPTRQWWNILCTRVWLGYPFTHHEKSYYHSSISDNPSLLSVLKLSVLNLPRVIFHYKNRITSLKKWSV